MLYKYTAVISHWIINRGKKKRVYNVHLTDTNMGLTSVIPVARVVAHWFRADDVKLVLKAF